MGMLAVALKSRQGKLVVTVLMEQEQRRKEADHRCLYMILGCVQSDCGALLHTQCAGGGLHRQDMYNFFIKRMLAAMKISLLFERIGSILEHLLLKVRQTLQVKLQPMLPDHVLEGSFDTLQQELEFLQLRIGSEAFKQSMTEHTVDCLLRAFIKKTCDGREHCMLKGSEALLRIRSGWLPCTNDWKLKPCSRSKGTCSFDDCVICA